MSTTLDGLIARLEKAEGPDRNLDADITRVVYLATMDSYAGERVTSWFLHEDGESFGLNSDNGWRHERVVRVMDYTASIDAAETTALKGWRWSVGNGLNGYEAHCFRTFPPGERDGSHGRGVSFSRLDAPTPAIALMTVLLKARKTEAAA